MSDLALVAIWDQENLLWTWASFKYLKALLRNIQTSVVLIWVLETASLSFSHRMIGLVQAVVI